MASKKSGRELMEATKAEAEIELIVILHPKKVTPKSFKGTRQQYLNRVTKIAMRDIKSALLVKSTVFVQS